MIAARREVLADVSEGLERQRAEDVGADQLFNFVAIHQPFLV
jgi:hypothetical protein